MKFEPFYVGALPRILFGSGRIADLPGVVVEYGRRALLVTGSSSFRGSAHWAPLVEGLSALGVETRELVVDGEPSPEMVDAAVARHHGAGIDVVVGIGGGSVLDAAKAVAALLPHGNSVLDHLEDVGRGLPYQGPSLPFIAVSTTAGTGSEATKNAVLSRHGPNGFKKSFRHECMTARVALLDPALLAGCPSELIAAQGMDAFTQLLESYLSLRANPFTDALAWSGLEAVKSGFMDAWQGGEGTAAVAGREAMAYAALLSGITLAQVGLGSVHGLAQPLGSLYPIPHGVACGTMVAEATAVNIEVLQARGAQASVAKYAAVGRLFAEGPHLDDAAACAALVSGLREWCERLALPRLGAYGIGEADVDAIVAASRNNSMKTNPVPLSDADLADLVRRRL